MKNKSGIHPVEYKILVLPDKVDDMSGGLYLPDSSVSRDQTAQERGLLIEVGGNAFEGWDASEDKIIPRAGNRVIYSKYSGMQVTGKDLDEKRPVIYRVMNDKYIVAIVD